MGGDGDDCCGGGDDDDDADDDGGYYPQIHVGRYKDMIRAKATIATWSQVLGTEFRWYRPVGGGGDDDGTTREEEEEEKMMMMDMVHRHRLRASTDMTAIPTTITERLAFISANTPVHFHSPLSGKSLRKSL